MRKGPAFLFVNNWLEGNVTIVMLGTTCGRPSWVMTICDLGANRVQHWKHEPNAATISVKPGSGHKVLESWDLQYECCPNASETSSY